MRTLPDWIRGYEVYNKDSESPDQYLRWAAIYTIAAAMQRKMFLRWGSETFYPNLYVVLLGPPACRKGTAVKPGRDILDRSDIPLSADSTSLPALIRALESSEQTATITEDGLPKTITHCSTNILVDELTVFLGYNDSKFLGTMCDWYDCKNTWAYDLVSRDRNHISGVWVNMLACTVPAMIQAALPPTAFGSGLTSRIIFVCAKHKRRKSPKPFFPMTPEGKKLFDDLTHDLIEISKMSGGFRFDDTFMDYYTQCYEQMPDECPFDRLRFDGYWGRRTTHLLKLAMIMNTARADGNMLLTERDMKDALRILEDAESRMHWAFGGTGRALNADLTYEVAQEVKKVKKITFTDLMKLFIRDADQPGLEGVVKTLEAAELVSVIHTGNGMLIESKMKEVS